MSNDTRPDVREQIKERWDEYCGDDGSMPSDSMIDYIILPVITAEIERSNREARIDELEYAKDAMATLPDKQVVSVSTIDKRIKELSDD